MTKDGLYQVMQGAQIEEEMTQLLTLRSCGEMLFHMAHHDPMLGHLEQDKTLNYLMAHFYWLDICGEVCR